MAYHRKRIYDFLDGEQLSREARAGIEGRLLIIASEEGLIANLDVGEVFGDEELTRKFIESPESRPEVQDTPLD